MSIICEDYTFDSIRNLYVSKLDCRLGRIRRASSELLLSFRNVRVTLDTQIDGLVESDYICCQE